MSDKFADLEEPKSRSKMAFLVAIVLFAIFVIYRWSTTDWQPLHGTIESVNASGIAKTSEPDTANASVRLPDGSLVEAEIVGGGSISLGDEVRLVVRPNSATGTPYKVVAKVPSTEP